MADESGKAVFNITAPNLKLEKVISRFVTVRLRWGWHNRVAEYQCSEEQCS
jgi:hypothetical protein